MWRQVSDSEEALSVLPTSLLRSEIEDEILRKQLSMSVGDHCGRDGCAAGCEKILLERLLTSDLHKIKRHRKHCCRRGTGSWLRSGEDLYCPGVVPSKLECYDSSHIRKSPPSYSK